ncbi:hypothetical protein BGZ98_000916 [Dissophora globulifera]|nr:hypothetical protein BGZ98_000916 [Dissophora globulifera]
MGSTSSPPGLRLTIDPFKKWAQRNDTKNLVQYLALSTDASMSGTSSSGAYRPGYKPPPVPSEASQPTSQLNNSSGGSPISPGRPSTASGRPSLPFLEKYAKKKTTATSSPPPPANNSSNGTAQNNNSYAASGSPLSVSPTTPTAPSNDRQVHSNGVNSHYQREQSDYFPKTPVDDRFPNSSQPQPSRSRTPLDDGGRYGSSSPVPGRSKTPVMDPESQFSSSPNSMRGSQQPALPMKSNARVPSIASAQGLGIQGLDANGRIKSPTGMSGYSDSRSDNGRDPRERDRERDWERGRYGENGGASSPSNGFNRSGSSGSAASSVLTEKAYQRERSNTVLSERSEKSSRSTRSERSDKERSRYPEDERGDRDRERERERDRDRGDYERGRDDRGLSSSRSGRQDPAAAYKTPSPPISPEDIRSVDALSGPKPNSYRPPTPPDVTSPTPTRGRAPPARKPSGDQFDALMDDLIKEIDVMPASTRDSTRPASSHRSRSRPNIPESGSGRARDLAGSPPPTPGLPRGAANGSDSGARSHRSGRERGDPRSERSERDRGEHRSERDYERDRGDRAERDVSDRDKERGQGRGERYERSDRGDRGDRTDRSDRDKERERGGVDRDREGERARERERTATSGRSSARSRSTSRRGAVETCQFCKYDILEDERERAIEMPSGFYHQECLKCARCKKQLTSARHAHELHGRILCEPHYQRHLEKESQRSDRPSRSRAAVCAGCDAPIAETPVYALGQAWHENHLKCYHCDKVIHQAEGHVEKNGRVYCPKDFAEKFLPKCRGCGEPVEKEAVCAQDGKLEGKWHAGCFGCQTCRRPFPDKSFYVYGNAPYCRRHYHKLNNSLCKSCDEPIEGPCAQTMEGWRFHPGCFSCVQCKTPLTDIYYNFENQAYCEKDIMVIQRTRNVRAERRKTFFGKV